MKFVSLFFQCFAFEEWEVKRFVSTVEMKIVAWWEVQKKPVIFK